MVRLYAVRPDMPGLSQQQGSGDKQVSGTEKMTHKGDFIKVHRKFDRWEWYQDSKTVHLFFHLLLKANWKDGRWKGREVKRGQLITGRNALSEETGIHSSSIHRILKRLEKSGEITQEVNNKFRVITICNYSKYQSGNQESEHQTNIKRTSNEQQANNRRTTSEHQVNTIEEGKERKEVIKKKNIKRKKPPSSAGKIFNPVSLKPDDIAKNDWTALISHRKAVKAVESERAYQAIIKQLKLANDMGFSSKDCIDEICNRSWKGFKADWMNNGGKGNVRASNAQKSGYVEPQSGAGTDWTS